MPERRTVALVLPQLACELARQRSAVKGPLGVVIVPGDVPGGGRSTGRAAAADAEPASRPPGADAERGRPSEVPPSAVLDVIDDEARRYGVRPGQKVTEATALVASLAVRFVTSAEIDAALGRIAEIALAYGTTAAIRLARRRAGDDEPRSASGEAPFDTVWLDITGAAHLVGGEEALVCELADRVASLGHRVRAAIADGPRVAQALARWAHCAQGAGGPALAGAVHPIVAPGEGARALESLPVQALPIDRETAGFLVRLGLLTIGDLARLPRAELAARLGPRAREALDLLAGHDAAPLLPYEPARVLVEEVDLDDGVENVEALLFVLRGITSRLAARLAGRGEACTRIEVIAPYDRSIAHLRAAERAAVESPRGEERGSGERDRRDRKERKNRDERGEREVEDDPRGGGVAPALRFAVDLPAPLADEGDLLRAVKARIERAELLAPAVGVRVVLPRIVPARRVQLDLSRDTTVSPDALPALLAELSAEIGVERVGVLSILDVHRPEARSRLVPIRSIDDSPARAMPVTTGPRDESDEDAAGVAPPMEPTRLLPAAVPLGRLARGSVVSIERQLYAVERVRFATRIDAVEWWTPSPVSRDYVRAWLVSGRAGTPGSACAEAWVYVDRRTGEAFLQGYCE